MSEDRTLDIEVAKELGYRIEKVTWPRESRACWLTMRRSLAQV